MNDNEGGVTPPQCGTDVNDNNHVETVSESACVTDKTENLGSGDTQSTKLKTPSVFATPRPSGIKPPATRIGRPCCSAGPKPGLPPTPTKRESLLFTVIIIASGCQICRMEARYFVVR